MTIEAAILLYRALREAGEYLAGVIRRAQAEGRDPTAEEVAEVKRLQAAAESRWASLAPAGPADPSPAGEPPAVGG